MNAPDQSVKYNSLTGYWCDITVGCYCRVLALVNSGAGHPQSEPNIPELVIESQKKLVVKIETANLIWTTLTPESLLVHRFKNIHFSHHWHSWYRLIKQSPVPRPYR